MTTDLPPLDAPATSTHDRKLQETVESVGAPGWFFKGDADNGVITVYPGMLPTFPKVINPPQQMWDSAGSRRCFPCCRIPTRGRLPSRGTR